MSLLLKYSEFILNSSLQTSFKRQYCTLRKSFSVVGITITLVFVIPVWFLSIDKLEVKLLGQNFYLSQFTCNPHIITCLIRGSCYFRILKSQISARCLLIHRFLLAGVYRITVSMHNLHSLLHIFLIVLMRNIFWTKIFLQNF